MKLGSTIPILPHVVFTKYKRIQCFFQIHKSPVILLFYFISKSYSFIWIFFGKRCCHCKVLNISHLTHRVK